MRMGRQKLRKLRSGCALSQKEHLARLDQLSGKGTDQALLGRVLQSPAVKAQFHAFSNMHRRAAVGLAQKTILFQAFDIAPNRHHRDAQLVGQRLGLNRLILSHTLQNQPPSFACQHDRSSLTDLTKKNKLSHIFIDKVCSLLYTLSNKAWLCQGCYLPRSALSV